MNTLKTILAIIGLILIGFVGGFITHRQMIKKEVTKVRQLGEAPFFLRHLMDVVDPTEEQRLELQPILREHAKAMGEHMRENRDQRQTLIKELEEKIHPILTEEQIERLERFNERFKRGARRGPGERRMEGPGDFERDRLRRGSGG
ncbi:MAG: hypothetical protein AAF242_12905 [Bacteroidota bacterium]